MAWINWSTNFKNNDQDDDEHETSEMQFEEYALKLNAGDFASRSKAKARPQTRRFCHLIHKNWTYWRENLDWCWNRNIFAQRLSSVEETDLSSSSWKCTSRTMMERLNSGELKKIIFRIILCFVIIGLMICGRARWLEEEEDSRKN